jgi:hypothetical protein
MKIHEATGRACICLKVLDNTALMFAASALVRSKGMLGMLGRVELGSSAARGPRHCQQPPSTMTTRHLSLSEIKMNSCNDVHRNSGCFQTRI